MKAHLFTAFCLAMMAATPAASAADAAPAQLLETAQALFKPIPDADFVVKEKGYTPDQIKLGQWLFFEPRLSKSNIITCNTVTAWEQAGPTTSKRP